MKIKLILLVSLFAFGFAMSANAGAITDTDNDLVPDAFDNCLTAANGPGDGSNQVDGDQDGYGNACDADYDNAAAASEVNLLDFGIFVACLGPAPNQAVVCDHNGVNGVEILDFGVFLSLFGSGAPGTTGPSGLACAGNANAPCTP
jgi:hypothetical protein